MGRTSGARYSRNAGFFRKREGMSYKSHIRAIVVAAGVVAASVGTPAGPAPGAEAAAGPTTIWNALGIPQGVRKIRDANVNRRGNRPNWERKPPLKRIADPANLESENPAIKAAAKIKTDQDLREQKVKAIKYLADIGCGCYPGVAEALMAALAECDEEIRYQAAIALCEAAGNHCDKCEKNSCCNAAVMSKLHEMAYEQDDKGCYKEASARVRAAATNALNACRRMFPEAPPQEVELPQEIELPQEGRELPQPGVEAPTPAPLNPGLPPELPGSPGQPAEPGTLPAPPGASSSLPGDSAGSSLRIINPIGFTEVSDLPRAPIRVVPAVPVR
jgi:hypothetical protein